MKIKSFPDATIASLAKRSFLPPFTSLAIHNNWHKPHPLVSYEANSDGFRAAEFIDAETVVLGCSTTFGIGLPLERTWPFKLGDQLGLTNVISIPGGSIPQIADVGLFIMSRFKLPKRVLFLTPNPERIHVAFSPNVDMKHTFNWSYDVNEFISMNRHGIDALKIQSFDGEYRSIPLELAVSESYKSLIRLGNFCKLIKADFHYFSWIDGVNKNFKSADIPGFIHGDSVQPSGPCHEAEKGREFWDSAIDVGRHPGEHHHEHYSKRFELILGSG